jgi:hypothetical protein
MPRYPRRLATLPLLVMAAALLGGGCGDDGGTSKADCPLPESCHGDITGSWQIAFGCPLDEVLESPDCPGWTCTIEDVEAEGYLEFAADGSAAIHWDATATTRCTIPKECLEGLGCDEAATEYGHFDCTDQPDSCDCVQTDADSHDMDGTWEIGEHSMLTVTEGDHSWGTTNFCVTGGKLTVHNLHTIDLEIPGEFTAFTTTQLVSERN